MIGDLHDIPEAGASAREVSGAAWHDGALWVVDNEDERHLLVMEPDGRFAPRALPADIVLPDLEGMASDGRHLYLLSGDRAGLARATTAAGEIVRVETLDARRWRKKLADKYGEALKTEGLAIDPRGRMLVGVRYPLTRKGKARVLSLEGWREAFDAGDPDLLRPVQVAKLDLNGGGISSLEWDPACATMLVLSIAKGSSDLWTWDLDGEPRHRARLRGHKAEGIARRGLLSQVVLLVDDEKDGTDVGRWGLVDVRPDR